MSRNALGCDQFRTRSTAWTVAYQKTGNLPLPEILRVIEVAFPSQDRLTIPPEVSRHDRPRRPLDRCGRKRRRSRYDTHSVHRTTPMQGAVRIHESELSPFRSVARLTETTLDSATGPFRSDGISIFFSLVRSEGFIKQHSELDSRWLAAKLP